MISFLWVTSSLNRVTTTKARYHQTRKPHWRSSYAGSCRKWPSSGWACYAFDSASISLDCRRVTSSGEAESRIPSSSSASSKRAAFVCRRPRSTENQSIFCLGEETRETRYVRPFWICSTGNRLWRSGLWERSWRMETAMFQLTMNWKKYWRNSVKHEVAAGIWKAPLTQNTSDSGL